MIRFFKVSAALALVAALGACSSSGSATRAAIPDDTMLGGYVQTGYALDSFTVSVPKSLKVNERNRYYPRGDIVWRGDRLGDRHKQVGAIFETSLANAAPQIAGTRAVRMDVQVLRFHGLSEKARYTIGGVHDIDFQYRLVDSVTGQQLTPVRVVGADLEALSGMAATEAEARGDTQKARIIAHLTQVFINEMTQPGGHQNADLGWLQRINDV